MKDMLGTEIKIGSRVFVQGNVRAIGETGDTASDRCVVEIDGDGVALVNASRITVARDEEIE